MSKRVFTSDLHFFHKNIVKYTDRKTVVSQADHTDWLIDIWNKEVNVSDHVFHLGDFAFTDKPQDINWLLKKLNGQKTFIKGNHDHMKVWNQLDGVYMKDYKEIKLSNGKSCVLFHFPMSIWHKNQYGAYHLHGHCHGSFQGQGRILDVGIDNAFNVYREHQFFTEEEVIEILEAKKIHVADGHVERQGEM